jgi:hypothetical protein
MKMRVSLGVKPSLTRSLEYVVDGVFHGFCLCISHYSGKFCPQKRVQTQLFTPEVLAEPVHEQVKAYTPLGA